MANPGATITTKDVGKFSELIAGYWKYVAAELGLEGHEISDIERTSAYLTQRDKAFQVLEVLRVRGCTYKQLSEALQRLKKGDHAKEVLPPQASASGDHEASREGGGSFSDEELKEKELKALSKCVTGVYEDLGSELGLTFDDVDRFTNDHTLKSPEAKALKMLRFWFGETKDTNKRETLAKALEDVARRDLAQKVRNKTL